MEKELLISFKDADIMNGESVVLYSVDIDIHSGDFDHQDHDCGKPP